MTKSRKKFDAAFKAKIASQALREGCDGSGTGEAARGASEPDLCLEEASSLRCSQPVRPKGETGSQTLLYNEERPHEAIGLAVPADRYRPSPRPFPAKLPEADYGAHEIVRTVPSSRITSVSGAASGKVPEVFRGERVAIRPISQTVGCDGVFFASHQIAAIDLTKPKTVSAIGRTGVRLLSGIKHQARPWTPS